MQGLCGEDLLASFAGPSSSVCAPKRKISKSSNSLASSTPIDEQVGLVTSNKVILVKIIVQAPPVVNFTVWVMLPDPSLITVGTLQEHIIKHIAQ